MKKLFLLLSLLFSQAVLLSTVYAQTGEGSITGRVVSRSERLPIQNANVTFWTDGAPITVKTNADGSFLVPSLPYGVYRITVEAADFMHTEFSVRVNTPERDINFVTMMPDVAHRETLDESSFSEFDFEGGDAQAAPVTLSASRDIFDNIAGFQFSSLRFRTRGYDTGMQNVYMNGILLNDAMTGYSPWSLWSGLNEATRNQESVSGLGMTDFSMGGINGVTNIDSRASSLRQGFRASVVNASAQYFLRLMATYSSGMLDNGWAFAGSVSLRYGPNLWVDGVYYNAWGYYFSAEKQFNPMSKLSFTVLGVPTKRGAQMAATDEAFELAGYYYNPNWGFQDGKMRNARVRNYHEPLAIVNFDHDFSDNTKFSVATSFRFGRNGYSALDWFKGADPKPDYYRNLPSYQTIRQNDANNDYDKFNDQWDFWRANTNGIQQINWQDLYDSNYNMKYNASDGLDPSGLPAGRAYYIVSERHTDQRDFNISANLSHVFNNHSSIIGGVAYRFNRTEYYALVKDLLGGDYWVNIDNFADRDDAGGGGSDGASRNNIRAESDIVLQGDKYGYDYYGFAQNARLWAIYTYNKGKWEAQAAAEGGYSAFHRQGLYEKGLFPGSASFGDSEKSNFLTYSAKASVTYKFSGAHQVTLSGVAMTNAPHFQDAFISPRTRNELVPNLTTEKIYGGDLTYHMRMPWATARVSAFYTQLNDQTKLISYYDDVFRAFTNFAMNGINQRHIGVEAGIRIPIVTGLSASVVASIGNYVYTDNPMYTQTVDNSAFVEISDEPVKYKGLYVENTPQTAINVSLNYRTDSYWFFELNANYFARYYLSMNPMRRSESTMALIRERYDNASPGVIISDDNLREQTIIEQQNAMIAQEKFDPAIVLNASIGKSWAFERKYYLGFSLQLKNLLSYVPTKYTQNIRTGGFESTRLFREQVDRDSNNNPLYSFMAFDSKYYYLYGLNWYLNIYFRF